MPPKKKVPARRASTGKSVSFSGSPSTIIPKTASSPSGRPRRETAGEVDYKDTRSRAPNGSPKKQAKSPQDAPAPKAVAADTPKKRGRPAKATTAEVASPKKAAATTASTPVKIGRGRPKKTETVPAPAVTKSPKRKRENEEPEAAPAKKRGRPSKAGTDAVAEAATPKKRGRPAKAAATTSATKTRKPLPVKVQKDEPKKVASKSKAVAKPATKRGRPASSTNKPTTATKATKPAKKGGKSKILKEDPETEVEDFVEGLTQDDEQEDGDLQYWLMKAEPNTRIDKNVDLAYPIDKLAKATEPEPWDGVRNYVARNNMRAMRKGDLAFFYHSNCDVPGIVGVMRIAEEHDVDETAFDPAHPYFDEKSDRNKPKWDCVKVEFVKKFNEAITLKELKNTPELSNMQIAQKAFSRLSVQKVTPDQWQFVLKMANEPEDLGVTSPVSGYEADTNGETDKEAVDESVTGEEPDAEAIAAYGKPDDAAEDVMNDQAVNLAAYGAPDDVADDIVDDEDLDDVQPRMNGHTAPVTSSPLRRMDDLERDETPVSGDDV
ncbi:hypothetical protein PMZ80_004404 [Knufia obscura]|uniref:EVE domain-containing protein n=1 Tax=Knufia obscura TaxID=1635080 RepID=A0ABR0RRZ7_9EURO|nr:hypothetical protein PMZ80_004404 [Knufia obscura]